MTLPKISIVTPSYNQAHFIEHCIQSVLLQEYPNLEYIIIDGDSNDGSQNIIKQYASNLYYWVSEPDQGQYDAINKGFAISTGDILAWINADDMYYPWTFRTIADVMSNLSSVDWITTLNPGGWDYHGFCSGFSILPGFSKDAFLDGYYLPFNPRRLGWIQQESTFWRRELWNSSGGYLSTELHLASDFELWCRFYEISELYGINIPLGGFRSQYHQKSRNIISYHDEAESSLARIRRNVDWHPNLLRKGIELLGLRKLSKINHSLLRYFGYSGMRIDRLDSDQPKARWTITNYRF